MNNLDPGVAEWPEDLIVYGGTGKAARNWEAFAATVRSPRSLAHDETLMVQSGKPVGTFQTHPGARGILQGTYETLAAVAQRHFDGTLSGRIVVTMNGGVVRHADAGYPQTNQTARDHGVRIPMHETSR